MRRSRRSGVTITYAHTALFSPPVDTLHTLRSLAAAQFGGDADAIDVDVTVDQLGIDSLGLLEFLFELEDHFGVSIPPHSMPDIPTLREVAANVDALLAARAQQPT